MASLTKRNGKWQARVRRKGFPTQTKSFTHKDDAQRWVRLTETQIETHELPKAPPCYPSFKEAIQRYSQEVSIFKKGHAPEKYRLAKLAQLKWAAKPLNEICSSHIAELRLSRIKEVTPPTVRKELYLISSIFETARKEWGFTRLTNPVSSIRMPSAANPRRTRIPPETLTRLMEAVEVSNPLLPTLIIVALETGMRRSELIRLKWTDINKDVAYLEDTKNGHSRYVPLSDTAPQAIDTLPKQSEEVFPMSANAVRLAWERLKNKHNIEGLRFHDLRHEAISRMFDEGLTVPEVASISGHRTVSMLFRYAHTQSIFSKNLLD